MIAPLRRLLPVVLLACAAGALPQAGASPVATAAGTCSIKGQERTFGPTYVTALSVNHTSCAAGKSVVKAFHACRLKHGKAGRCVTKVKGYACRETRNAIPTQFSAKVVCGKGKARVTHTYTQFT